eukprot:PhM_4_TR9200/c0_g1_i1/m.11232
MLRRVVGNTSKGIKKPSDSLARISIIAGNEALKAQRLFAGEYLSAADICAARCALSHLRLPHEDKISVATVAVDGFTFRAPAYHGDYLTYRGSLVSVGKSSMAVRVECTAEDVGQHSPRRQISASVFHMVAIGKDLKTSAVVPALELETEHEVKMCDAVYARRTDTETALQKMREVKSQDPPSSTIRPSPDDDRPAVNIPDTEVVLDRIFSPGDLNFNNTVFGGEIMRWMERGAALCARRFTGNTHTHAMAMHSLKFKEPILTSDWVSVRSTVVFVRDTTLEVKTRVFVEREGRCFSTQTASFVYGSFEGDEIGATRRRVPSVVVFDPQDRTSLRSHTMAAFRFNWIKQNPEHKLL